MHPMFTGALYTIAETWKQPKCPSTDDWFKKMWCVYRMEYQPQRMNIAICSNTDGPREYLSEVSQTEKDKYYMLSLTCGI